MIKHILGVTDSPEVQKVSTTKNSRKCNLANPMKRSCFTFTVTYLNFITMLGVSLQTIIEIHLVSNSLSTIYSFSANLLKAVHRSECFLGTGRNYSRKYLIV